MATIEQEQSAPIVSDTRWEARPVPDDFRVGYRVEPEADPEDPLTVEAYWDGEAKVTAEIDVFEGVSNIDLIGRPSHWGEDDRPASEQRAEYVLGLDGIVNEVTRSADVAVEINNQKGVIAQALLVLMPPPGWRKATKLVSYDVWTESPAIDIGQAVAEGAVISLRYEKSPVPNPGLGLLAIESVRTQASSHAA